MVQSYFSDAYGRVKFSSIKSSKYIRLDAYTPIEDVGELMFKVFKLHIPGLCAKGFALTVFTTFFITNY